MTPVPSDNRGSQLGFGSQSQALTHAGHAGRGRAGEGKPSLRLGKPELQLLGLWKAHQLEAALSRPSGVVVQVQPLSSLGTPPGWPGEEG